MTEPIRAIVLTCQRYAPLAEHMIDAYDAAWPDHPFRFRLPDGPAMREVAARRRAGAVELVPTDEGEGRGRFRAAVLGLLAGLHDDAWVYWSIDDKYPIWIDRDVVRRVAEALEGQPAHVAGLCCTRRPCGDRESAGPDAETPLRVAGLSFHRRGDYKRIWLHQFVRVKLLRRLFETFPEVVAAAKDLDALHARAVLPADHGRYTLDRDAIVFGESTHRGMLTSNCAASLRRGRGLPRGFEVSPTRLLIGRRPGWWTRLVGAWRESRRCA